MEKENVDQKVAGDSKRQLEGQEMSVEVPEMQQRLP